MLCEQISSCSFGADFVLKLEPHLFPAPLIKLQTMLCWYGKVLLFFQMTGKDYDQSKNLKITQQQILNDSIYRRYLEELTASLVAQLQCGRCGFDLWLGKIPWRRERLPTPVFWPGEFHGLYSPWGRKEWNMTQRLSLSFSEDLRASLVAQW